MKYKTVINGEVVEYESKPFVMRDIDGNPVDPEYLEILRGFTDGAMLAEEYYTTKYGPIDGMQLLEDATKEYEQKQMGTPGEKNTKEEK